MEVGQPDAGFKGALARAYRSAYKRGIREVGTDLVLSYAFASVPAASELLPLLWSRAWRPVRRGRSGLTDAHPVDVESARESDAVRFETDAVLRLAAYDGSDLARMRRRVRRKPQPEFTPAVRYAVQAAIREAVEVGVPRARCDHLLLGLLAVRGGAADQLLGRWTEPRPYAISLKVRADPAFRTARAASAWAVLALKFWRVVPAHVPRFWRPPWRAVVGLLDGRLRRRYRRCGALYGHPVLLLIEMDAPLQAVQCGQTVITSAHVLLSVVEVHAQVAAAGNPWPDGVARWNRAGEVLAAYGVEGRRPPRVAAQSQPEPGDAEDDRSSLPTRGWPKRRPKFGTPTWGRTGLAALREASLSAYRMGHPYAGTSHLLTVLLAEPDGPASRLLRDLGVNREGVRTAMARRFTEDPRS